MTAGVGGYNGNSIDAAAVTVGGNVSQSEANLMEAYSLREGTKDDVLIALGNKLGIVKYQYVVDDKGNIAKDNNGNPVIAKDNTGNAIQVAPDLKGLQMIAEQRYQHSGRIYNMFSSLLDKMDQMKQRVIQKFGQS
ncbi:MAG: hypothetical protein ACK5GN_11910 [Pseudomonadota bacterium]|jgi:hypothetical protein